MTIKRGRLSEAEKATIESMAASMRSPTPGKIARRLNRHPATINWYMISHGLIARTIRYHVGRPSDTLGRTYWQPQHDKRLLQLRKAGVGLSDIAAALTAEFGFKRKPHSVANRLAMLAAYGVEE